MLTVTWQHNTNIRSAAVFRISEIFARILILGSVPKIYGAGSDLYQPDYNNKDNKVTVLQDVRRWFFFRQSTAPML
jgi:hypothetical protein